MNNAAKPESMLGADVERYGVIDEGNCFFFYPLRTIEGTFGVIADQNWPTWFEKKDGLSAWGMGYEEAGDSWEIFAGFDGEWKVYASAARGGKRFLGVTSKYPQWNAGQTFFKLLPIVLGRSRTERDAWKTASPTETMNE